MSIDDETTRDLLTGLATFASSEHLSVGKDGWNPHFSFAYMTEPAVFTAAREALAEAGLSATMSFEQATHEIIPTFDREGNERPSILATVAARLTIRDKHGQQVECVAFGMGLDPADKALAKAETQASKIVVQKALLIAVMSEDTDEGDTPRVAGRASSNGGAASERQLGFACSLVKKILNTPHGETEPMVLRLARMGGDPATEFKAISRAACSDLIERLKKVEENPQAGDVILQRLAEFEGEAPTPRADSAAAGQPDIPVES